jgi:hypothetical protein
VPEFLPYDTYAPCGAALLSIKEPQFIIYFQEYILYTFAEISGGFQDFFSKLTLNSLGTVLRNLFAAMAVKNAEKATRGVIS